ncbi:hypothetical protein DPX16_19760 [Anabarilius grahami]|uniref:Uncharacterized protein n=1 Tax=Anabarilius grahami TaxID=495550 RepID=A0A3N0XQ75_ANAGA|nr:hypothetical protein DPX16_19760 [Anabarilius grahami]
MEQFPSSLMIAGSRWFSSAPLPKMRTPFHATLPGIDARFMDNWGKIEPFIRYQKTKHSSDAKSKRHTRSADIRCRSAADTSAHAAFIRAEFSPMDILYP